MKKIITALDNKDINLKLNKIEKFKVLTKDIPYQDGIFEALEKFSPDILLLSEILPGKLDIKELILEIKDINKEIEIIVFLENENIDLINFLKLNQIYMYYNNNKITVNELAKNIEKENNKMEIKYIKNIISNNINDINEKAKIKRGNIITILGSNGIGKSVFTIILSKILAKLNKKVLIIDLDVINNNISKIKDSKYVNIISGKDILFKEEKVNINKIKNKIEMYKKEYDYILIDSSSECYFKLIQNIINISERLIYIAGSNILEVKKSINLLKIYTEEWKIKKEKVNIIINQFNNYSIDKEIIKNLFNNFIILGKINFSEKYNLFINSNFENKNIINEIEKEYNKIVKKIC